MHQNWIQNCWSFVSNTHALWIWMSARIVSPRSNTWPPEVLSSQLRPYPNGKIFMYLPKTQSTDKNGINLRSHEFKGSTAFPENVCPLVCRSWRKFNQWTQNAYKFWHHSMTFSLYNLSKHRISKKLPTSCAIFSWVHKKRTLLHDNDVVHLQWSCIDQRGYYGQPQAAPLW
jgi:hypothetical protein